MLIAVNFHYVRPVFDAPYPGIHGITPARFGSQLELLGKAGQFVSGSDILDAIHGTRRLPERSLVVTFDDGLREQYEHAVPVLRRLGIPALFFVNTRPIETGTVSSVHKIHQLRSQVAPGEFTERLIAAAADHGIALTSKGDADKGIEHYKYDTPEAARLKYLLNFTLSAADRDALVEVLFDDIFGTREAMMSRELYMGREQIAELAREGSIGTHAHEHLPLGLLSREEAGRQLAQSVRLLDEWTGRRPFALSYPYGSREASSPQVAAAAAEQGIELAFTMERAANRDLAAPLHLARFDNNDLPGGKAARFELEEMFGAAPVRTWYTENDPVSAAK
jgi:peptidoglycan/xylan/chitin deacetylase (PgdA/CDA1 family)